MKWAMVLVGTVVVATVVVVGAVVVVTQEDKPTSANAAYEPTSTPIAEESTTTSTSATTAEPPTTTLPGEIPDLSGAWDAIKTVGTDERGTVLISQTGLTFTLIFSDGFDCRPADACVFDGTVEALENDDANTMYVWMARNSGSADDKGGTYETFFGFQPFAAYDGPVDTSFPLADLNTGEPIDTSGWYMGVGQSVYRGGGEEKEWDGQLLLMPFG